MKIAIDATTLQISNSGITSYLKGILMGFEALGLSDRVNLYTPDRTGTNTKSGGLKKKIDTLYRELYWQQHRFPQMASKDGNSIVFSPTHNIALKAKLPRFITFHDLYLLRNPKAFPKWQELYGKHFYPRIIESGCSIITISNFTASELDYFFPHVKGNIKVINSAVSDEWKRIEDKNLLQQVLLKYGIPSEFLLAVGSVEPRKNLATLFELINSKTVRDLPPLVLVSPGGWNNKNELKVLAQLIEAKKVIWLRNIERNDLIALYNQALLFIYPSLYEGMGMPPLEAMSCGCPVITSNNSALKELYHGAAELINPLDIEDISASIRNVLQLTDKRSGMIERGLKLRQDFSFTKVADETINFFKETM